MTSVYTVRDSQKANNGMPADVQHREPSVNSRAYVRMLNL